MSLLVLEEQQAPLWGLFLQLIDMTAPLETGGENYCFANKFHFPILYMEFKYIVF